MLASQDRDVQQKDSDLESAASVPPEPFRFVIRILAERKEGQWQAFTLELGLAAQADSLPEVKQKLDSMIRSYLLDALAGEDHPHAVELLTRKATWQVYAKYHLCSIICRIGMMWGKSRDHVIYNKLFPLEPRFS